MLIKKNLKILEGQAQLDEEKTILDIVKSLDQELLKGKSQFPKILIHYLENRSYEKASKFLESHYKDM